MTDYTEKEFDVDKKSFKNIKKGDSGVLTYQNHQKNHRSGFHSPVW